uniref:Uncharacterized protein n=1 Tax=Chlamydomonas leiostraca TaxID=1034604 RepID=A0A7S0S3U5_9CHLO|mmetsp:Transcript_7589/g.18832  ORF Transcript_7589/g.18832 Transcript_7589/m.18832 type:complete len:437 (+) Transcript_7589:219-1529(+)
MDPSSAHQPGATLQYFMLGNAPMDLTRLQGLIAEERELEVGPSQVPVLHESCPEVSDAHRQLVAGISSGGGLLAQAAQGVSLSLPAMDAGQAKHLLEQLSVQQLSMPQDAGGPLPDNAAGCGDGSAVAAPHISAFAWHMHACIGELATARQLSSAAGQQPPTPPMLQQQPASPAAKRSQGSGALSQRGCSTPSSPPSTPPLNSPRAAPGYASTCPPDAQAPKPGSPEAHAVQGAPALSLRVPHAQGASLLAAAWSRQARSPPPAAAPHCTLASRLAHSSSEGRPAADPAASSGGSGRCGGEGAEGGKARPSSGGRSRPPTGGSSATTLLRTLLNMPHMNQVLGDLASSRPASFDAFPCAAAASASDWMEQLSLAHAARRALGVSEEDSQAAADDLLANFGGGCHAPTSPYASSRGSPCGSDRPAHPALRQLRVMVL